MRKAGALAAGLIVGAAVAYWALRKGPAPAPGAAAATAHASGARVAGGGALREVERPASLKGVELTSPVLRYDLFGKEPVGGKTAVDLPGGEGTVVLVKGDLGFWLPLPSVATTLADGRPGRRIEVDGRPTPWVMTTAKGGLPATPGELVRLEQLWWTDAAGLERESGRAPPRERAEYISSNGPDPVRLLTQAVQKFYRAGAAVKLGQRGNAWQRYLEGLRLLADVRRAPRYWNATIDLGDDPWPEGLPRSMALPVVLETLTAGFAPWGLELTLRLAASDENLLAEGFDLRVLKPLGEALYADVAIAVRGRSSRLTGPWDGVLDALIKSKGLVAGETKRSVMLRFYSPRSIEEGYIEQALEFTKDTILRWGPTFLAFYTGGASAAALPASWAALDTAVDWLGSDDPVTYATLEFGPMGGEQACELAAAVEDTELRVLGATLSVERICSKLTLVDILATSALLYMKWRPEQVRELAAGYPKGYMLGEDGEHPTVPPILLIGWVDGPQARPAESRAYAVGGRYNRVWQFNYDQIYAGHVSGEGLHRTIKHGDDDYDMRDLSGWAFGGGEKGIPWALILSPLPEDWLPSPPPMDTAPHEQAIAFYLRKDLIASICTARGIAEAWDRVELGTLGLEVAIEVPGGETVVVPLREEPTIRKRPDARRCAVHLCREGREPTPRELKPVGYQVEEVAEIPRLTTRYGLVVKDREGERAWFRAEADFRGETAKKFVLKRDTDAWWGAGEEPVPWAAVDVPSDDAPAMVSGMAFMEMPHRYSIRGSLRGDGDAFEGLPFRWDVDAETKLDWKGRTTTFTEVTGDVTETLAVTLGEGGTKIAKAAFRQSSTSFAHVTTFELTDVPLRYTGRTAKGGIEILVFGIRDSELRTHLKVTSGPATRTVEEYDPETKKTVTSSVTHTITSMGDGGSFFCVMMSNKTNAEIMAMGRDGIVTEAELDDLLNRVQKALEEWAGK